MMSVVSDSLTVDRLSRLSSSLGYIGILLAFVMFIACNLQTAVYGRYATSKGWGPLIPAKWAWIIMESPNLFVFAIVIWMLIVSDREIKVNIANMILSFCFMSHYVHRDLVFPFYIEKTKPNAMPVSVMLLAFIFCCFNGLSQALSLVFGEQKG